MKFLLLILFISSSCSFKPNGDDKGEASKKEQETLSVNSVDPLTDSDGDMILDIDEIKNGTDPVVADIPKVDVSFIQDYSIEVIFEDESSFRIDTTVARDNPNFKYRVGELFLKENSLNNAAKLGRFSGVSWGEITQKDFSWIKYPDTDKEYYHSKVLEFSKHKGKKIQSLTLDLENTLRLQDSPYYPSIDSLEVNFYYYSHSKESYVLIHTEKIEKTFQSGVRESFAVTIHNPPLELFEDSYLRRGEFIISEVKDFNSPDRMIKNSTLLSSVKNKTIPVYVSTPYESGINYVAISERGEKFISVLKKLYSDKFSIVDEKLEQVEQFTNKLSDFTYLHEVKENDKDGNWFVMTNKLKDHYLKHTFTNADSITLSYVTGAELANQKNETFFSLTERVDSTDSYKKYPLGNVTKNSVVEASIYIQGLHGVRLNEKFGEFFFAPRCNSRNCSGTDWFVKAPWVINSFSKLDEPFNFNELSDIGDKIRVLINNTELNLSELVKQNQATYELKRDAVGQYLHIQLTGLDKIEVLQNGTENTAFLMFYPLKKGWAGLGLEIGEVTGRNINPIQTVGPTAFEIGMNHRVSAVAVTSWKFSEWQKYAPWDRPAPNGWIPRKGEKQMYWSGLVVDVVSTITNNFN